MKTSDTPIDLGVLHQTVAQVHAAGNRCIRQSKQVVIQSIAGVGKEKKGRSPAAVCGKNTTVRVGTYVVCVAFVFVIIPFPVLRA